MTEEDKQLISKYMGWIYGQTIFHVTMTDTYIEPERAFDLNDARLCIGEMQKRGDWWNFLRYANTSSAIGGMFPEQFIALLFNADNFFKAFVEWRKGK